MKVIHIPLYLATAALVSTFAVTGCSKSAPPANSQNPTPAAQQPADANNPPAPPADNTAPAATAAQPSSAPSQPPAPPPAARVTIPAGTPIRVRLDQDLGSKISQAGQSFDATVAENVVVHGQTVIPREARAEGVVIDAKSLGHFKGGALLELRLERVKTRWGSYPVSTSTMARAEKGKGKRTALFAGGGGALGAIVGGLAGGGKGALIGGLAGAGAGTAGSAMTGNKEIFLPTETLLTFRIEHPVHITEQ